MENLWYKRGDVVAYGINDEVKMGVIVQNDAGNRFGPTLIVSAIELIPIGEIPKIQHILLRKYSIDGTQMVCFPEFLHTIDKKRVYRNLGNMPYEIMERISTVLDRCYSFEECKIIYTNLPKGVGCEQTGERPVLVLKEFSDGPFKKTIGLALTTKLYKNEMPTHLMFWEGEGNLKRSSLVMAEQVVELDTVADEQFFVGVPPADKIPMLKKIFEISVGIRKVIRTKTQTV